MRTGATQRQQFTPDVKVTVNSVTYDTNATTGRILHVKEEAKLLGGKYTIVLDNNDEALNTTDFTGKPVNLYWSFEEEAGSYTGILTVESQAQTSYKGRHAVELICIDEIAKFSLFKGSVGGSVWNHPSQSSTALAKVILPSGEPLPASLITAITAQYDKTAKQISDAVVAATTGVTFNYDSGGYADAYLTSQKPLVQASDARQAIWQALMGCVSYLKPKTNTTQIDVINPAAHASVYTYADTSWFFSDVVAKEVLTPNQIIYHGIATDHTTLLTTNTPTHGTDATSVALIGAVIEHRDYDPMSRENSTTQAQVDGKADVAIAKVQLGGNTGILIAPMHCSQELGDAVTIVDDSYTPSKTITGYVFGITREYDKHVYTITLQLGGLESGYTPQTGGAVNVAAPVVSSIAPYSSISTLPVAVQGYYVDVTFSSVDADTVAWTSGTIKFYDGTTQAVASGNTGSMTGTNLYYIYFDLADASPNVLKQTTNYLSVMTSETGVVCIAQKGSGSTNTARFIPSFGKEPLITADLIYLTGLYDQLPDGTYGKVLSTIIAAGLIQVGSGTKDSTLDGWNISSTEIVGQLDGVDQVVLNTNGEITAAAGGIVLNSTHLGMVGAVFDIYTSSISAGNRVGVIDGNASGFYFTSDNDYDIVISADGTGDIILDNYTFPSEPKGMEYVARYRATRDIP